MKTQVDIYNGIDQPYRIYQDVFLTAVPHTQDPGKHRDPFEPG
jgi:hypothetical protein